MPPRLYGRPATRPLLHHAPPRQIRRQLSTPNPPTKPSSAPYASSKTHASPMLRFHSRMPRFLQRVTAPLLSAPITHITSFLILHEITAIVPLFTLAGIFHYTNWLPPFISEGKWVSDGVEKFGRYFRRKGWLGNSEVTKNNVDNVVQTERGGQGATGRRERWWNRGEGGVRLVVEFATAYAVTKALLPARLVLSVWGTPWFARNVTVPMGHTIKRFFGGNKPKKVKSLPAGGTGVAEAGAEGGSVRKIP